MYAICSVIAAGTFGIMNLNLLRSTISPFNRVQNLYFTVEEVRKLFYEFVQDHHITIDDAIVEDIWAKSNGCVTLLNQSINSPCRDLDIWTVTYNPSIYKGSM